jgi:hypothetical protein
MLPTNLSICMDFDGLRIENLRLDAPFQPTVVSRVLGREARVFTGPIPAPVKHRNNWGHLYDDFGIGMIDHHATQLVEEFAVYLVPDSPPHGYMPKGVFAGHLTVCDVPVTANTPAAEVILASGRNFEQKLPGMWSYREGRVHIGLIVHSTPSLIFRERTAKLQSVSIDLGGRVARED